MSNNQTMFANRRSFDVKAAELPRQVSMQVTDFAKVLSEQLNMLRESMNTFSHSEVHRA